MSPEKNTSKVDTSNLGWFELAELGSEKKPSLRMRLEEMMKDGKMTSEELRNIANELDASREQTATELKNLKAVVGDFGLRILREYTVKDQGDVDKLTLLLKALKRADIIKDDITIEKLPTDGTGMKLHYDEKEKKMRAIGLFERIWQDADETKVTPTDLLRLRFANAIPKDEASRNEIKTLIANLREVEGSENVSNQIRGVNEVLKEAFNKNPLPENIRISQMGELPAIITFLEEFMKRKEEPKAPASAPASAVVQAPVQTTALAPDVAQAPESATAQGQAPATPPTPVSTPSKISETSEKPNYVSAFVTALSSGTHQNRITNQVSKQAKTGIESALSQATIDEASLKILAMPLGDRQKNEAFQQAVGMKQPHDGYIGYLTINALMAKVGSTFRLPENHYKKTTP